jgi:type IV secretory pathway VirB2 component (pilin)
MSAKQKQVVKHAKYSFVDALYTLFLGLLLALVIGLGVSAFYEAPKAPEYPTEIMMEGAKENTPDVPRDQKLAQEKFDADYKKYEQDYSAYTQNVSIITLALAVVALAISLLVLKNVPIMSNSLLLGGIFTLVYSMIRGFMTDDTKYRFLIAVICLGIALAIGYIRFVRPNQLKEADKK